MFRTPGLIAITLAALALTGCTGGPAPTSADPDPKESCQKFEAATKNLTDTLGKSPDGTLERAMTSMNEAAAFASGDVQKAMGEAILTLPPEAAELATPDAKNEVKAVNSALDAVGEVCKSVGADIAMPTIPAG